VYSKRSPSEYSPNYGPDIVSRLELDDALSKSSEKLTAISGVVRQFCCANHSERRRICYLTLASASFSAVDVEGPIYGQSHRGKYSTTWRPAATISRSIVVLDLQLTGLSLRRPRVPEPSRWTNRLTRPQLLLSFFSLQLRRDLYACEDLLFELG
jgi:hypothetical protein